MIPELQETLIEWPSVVAIIALNVDLILEMWRYYSVHTRCIGRVRNTNSKATHFMRLLRKAPVLKSLTLETAGIIRMQGCGNLVFQVCALIVPELDDHVE